MRAIGFNRRPDQIQCKTKKWKSLYVNVLRQRAKGKRVTCRYFKDLVEIFGDTSDKLGASAAAEAGDDIVEIELSHGAAVAANRRSDSEYDGQGFIRTGGIPTMQHSQQQKADMMYSQLSRVMEAGDAVFANLGEVKFKYGGQGFIALVKDLQGLILGGWDSPYVMLGN